MASSCTVRLHWFLYVVLTMFIVWRSFIYLPMFIMCHSFIYTKYVITAHSFVFTNWVAVHSCCNVIFIFGACVLVALVIAFVDGFFMLLIKGFLIIKGWNNVELNG